MEEISQIGLGKSKSIDMSSFNPLKFSAQGTFQLSILEDLHFGENPWNQWGPQQDVNTVNVLNKVLDYDPPDLVVLNGDLITGENTYLENSTTLVDQMVKPMVDRGLPWASTYGNHDYQMNVTGETILERERQWPNALTQQMVFNDDAGTSNYYLPVYLPNCTEIISCSPELLLWFFDSRGGSYYQQKDANGNGIGQPNWVDVSVVEWFQQTNADLVNLHGGPIPSLAFTHIPVYAFGALQNSGVHPNRQPGINDDDPLAPQAQGWCSNGVNDGSCEYGGQDIPFMNAITTTPGLMALFSGHDHGDTWCYKWDTLASGMTVKGNGINLCFGQHSGYGGYGNWIRGARQVLITQEKLKNWEVDTWIRTENDGIVGSVSLNATYGQDQYPPTNNEKTGCNGCNYTIITPMPGTRGRRVSTDGRESGTGKQSSKK